MKRLLLLCFIRWQLSVPTNTDQDNLDWEATKPEHEPSSRPQVPVPG